MVRSMQSAIAGLKAHQTKMDVIGNNIANVNTWGYKSQSTNFSDAMYQNYITGAAGNATDTNQGGINTSQIGYGTTVSSITSNFETGSQSFTGRPFDCMINGPAFFVVGGFQTAVNADGVANAGLKLTKVGIFQMDSNGYLVDDQGNYVYGYVTGTVDGDGNVTVTEGTTLSPIQLNKAITNGGSKDIEYSSVKIGFDGTITVVDTKGTSNVVGKLATAVVENTGGLEHSGGYLYDIGANAGQVSVSQPSSATGDILSNYLEMPNVDLATEMASMITTQRGYQANTKMITVSDEMLEELVNMKR